VRVFLCLTNHKEPDLSTEETALPDGVNTDAGASEPADSTAAAANTNEQAGADGTTDPEAKAKPEKTPEQREIDRLRRRVDNLTRQKYELRANAPAPQQQHHQQGQDDNEPVTLTRAELQRQIAEQAQRLAPSLSEQNAEIERRQGVVSSLAKDWGQEKFDTLSSELDEAFGGLSDRSGTPKPATEAIFYAENPKAVIEYLTDPDNADEADRISRMSAVQAGRAIGKLEDQLAAEKSQAKPKPSNAPKPLEPARSSGGVTNKDPSKMNDAEFAAWRRQQINQRK
jgi:hypothetical protein